MKKWYRIYGKEVNSTKMQPLNWASGTFTPNLMYATIFNEKKAKSALEEINKLNSDKFVFELREVKELRGKDWY